MAKNYVFSTLACNQNYTNYALGQDNNHIPIGSVIVKGGTGVSNRNFITPQGVMTEVSDDELALLEANYSFNEHIKKGFIIVSKKKAEPEKVASDMSLKDKSAPLTDADSQRDQYAAAIIQ